MPARKSTHPGAIAPGWGLLKKSVGVGAEHFTLGLGAQGPPCRWVDRVLDESDAAVREANVDAAGVIAHRLDVVGMLSLDAAIDAAGTPLVLVGRGNRIEHRVAHRAVGPAPARTAVEVVVGSAAAPLVGAGLPVELERSS